MNSRSPFLIQPRLWFSDFLCVYAHIDDNRQFLSFEEKDHSSTCVPLGAPGKQLS